jgi:adenylylsulfate kinase-like enzyme
MLITELIAPVEEGVYDPHIFKAVFMAGSPGAGKSTIANKLF